MFARTYLPSAIERGVKLWKEWLGEKKHRAASLIADPINNPDLFPEHPECAERERQSTLSITSSHQNHRSHEKSHSNSINISFDEESFSKSTGHSLNLTSPQEPAYSDHMSMEVNTGTGSIRTDDLDDLGSVTVSESRDESITMARNLERLSIQELDELDELYQDEKDRVVGTEPIPEAEESSCEQENAQEDKSCFKPQLEEELDGNTDQYQGDSAFIVQGHIVKNFSEPLFEEENDDGWE